jgi:TRAP-type C4-dicarboxylate transport system substrate-binding protein
MLKKVLVVTLSLVLMASILVLSAGCGGGSTPSSSQPASSQPAAKAQVIRLANFSSSTMDEGIYVEQMAAEFNKKFAGRYEIKVFPNESLVKMMESQDATRTGMTEMCIYPLGVFAATEASYNATEIPFMFASIPAMAEGMAQLTPEYSKIQEQKYGQKLLTLYTIGGLEMCSPKKTIKTMDDWKGMLVAALSPLQQGMVKSLGGSAISIPPMEGYSSLEKKVVDASNQSLANMVQVKLYEVAPFVTAAIFCPTGIGLHINLDYYNKLPADVQQGIVDFGTGYQKLCNAYQVPKEDNARKALADQKCEIYNVPGVERQKWADACKAFGEQKLAESGPVGEKVKQIAAELNKKYPYPY